MISDAMKHILNFRRLQLYEGELYLVKGTSQEKAAHDAYLAAKLAVENDGHSGGSYVWTMYQSRFINQHGWKKWLSSDAARQGYLPFKSYKD